MRGNEEKEAAEINEGVRRFPIPMRGNELELPEENHRIRRPVPDPHEG